MGKFKAIAAEIGETVTAKNLAYGDSFAKTGDFLRILYPAGIEPGQYGDALCMVRIFDKQMRIATAKDALGESPYRDIAGYAVLGIAKDQDYAADPFRSDDPATAPDHLEFCVETKYGYHPTPAPLDLSLPSVTVDCSELACNLKWQEEMKEWGNCCTGTLDSAIEAWDVKQAAQTWWEHGKSDDSAKALLSARERLVIAYSYGDDVMKAKRIMMIKLAARAMYSPEDCARILADV